MLKGIIASEPAPAAAFNQDALPSLLDACVNFIALADMDELIGPTQDIPLIRARIAALRDALAKFD